MVGSASQLVMEVISAISISSASSALNVVIGASWPAGDSTEFPVLESCRRWKSCVFAGTMYLERSDLDDNQKSYANSVSNSSIQSISPSHALCLCMH